MKVVVRVDFVFDTEDFMSLGVFVATPDTKEAHLELAERIVKDQLTEINEEGAVESSITSIEELSS